MPMRATAQESLADRMTAALVESQRQRNAERRSAEARNAPAVLRASGVRILPTSADALRELVGQRQAWQSLAWGYRDMIGELRFALQFRARNISRATFYVAQVNPDDDSDEPLPVSLRDDKDPEKAAQITLSPELIEAAQEELQRLPLSDGYGFLGVWCENWDVAGEAYLHGYTDGATGKEVWQIRSVEDVDFSGATVTVRDAIGRPRKVDLTVEELYRLHIPHPRKAYLADSALNACMDVLEDIVLIGRELRAASRSRIAANGVWLVPDGLYMARNTIDDTDTIPEDGGRFATDLTAAMLAPISNEGDAGAVAPIVLRGNRADIEVAAKSHIRFDREDSPTLLEKLTKALSRLATSIDIPPEILTGMAEANHWCKTAGHRVYTKDRGWVSQDRLSVGDTVMALDHETGQARWEPVLDIYRADVVDEPMIRMESRAHLSISTPNHRWPIIKTGRKVAGSRRRWTTTGDGFGAADRVPTAAPIADAPGDMKWSDDFVRLVACYTSDGARLECTETNLGRVRIAKFDGYEIEETRRVLRAVYDRAVPEAHHPTATRDGVAFLLSRPESALLFTVTGEHKAVHLSFIDDLTQAQCALFLEALLDIGDGVRHAKGAATYYQVEPSRLVAIERAAHVCGYSVTRGVRDRNTGFSDRPLHWIRVGRAKNTFTPHSCQRTEEPYTGVLWCPVTPSKTWFCQGPDGSTYFTGNTAWQIDASTYKQYLEPSLRLMADSLTAAQLHAALAARGFGAEEIARVRYWYNGDGITENPNRRQDALDARANNAISDKAFRDALGFDDGDAPSEEEVLMMVASRVGMDSAAASQVLRWAVEQQGGDLPALPAAPAAQAPASPPAPADTDPEAVGGNGTPDTAPSAVAASLAPPAPAEPLIDREKLAAFAEQQREEKFLAELDAFAEQLAAGPSYTLDTDTGRALMDIDRALRDRLLEAADTALTRARERAGSRLRSKATRDPAIRASLAQYVPAEWPARLGREQALALGADSGFLLAQAWDELAGKFSRWVAATIDRLLPLVARLAGRPVDDPAVVRLRTEMAARVPAAWDHLQARLDEVADARLYGEPDERDDMPGEVPDLEVPPYLVRAALAEVGGLPETSGGLDRFGRPVTGEPANGLHNGSSVADVLEDAGVLTVGYLWVYGITPMKRQFEPHAELEGTRFTSWRDPKLDTAGTGHEWVGPYFRTGDHPGCMCDFVPGYAVPDYAAQVRERLSVPSGSMSEMIALAEEDDRAGRRGTTAQQVRDQHAEIQRLQSRFLDGA